MSLMPWRIVVVTDVGVDSGNPAEITPGPKGADGWFASLGIALPLPGAGTPDAVLHDPKTQRVEAAWRGLNLLASHAAEPLLLEALSVPRAQLVARFREEVYEPALESGAPPLTLVVLDFDFTHKASDVADLAALGAMAADLQACVVAHAHAGILDLRFLVQAAAGIPLTVYGGGGQTRGLTVFIDAVTSNRYGLPSGVVAVPVPTLHCSVS